MPSGISLHLYYMPQPRGRDIRSSWTWSIYHRGILNSVEMHDVRLLHSARHRTRIPAYMRLQLRSQALRQSERVVHFHHEHHDIIPALLWNIRIYLRTRYHQLLQKRRQRTHRHRNKSAEMAVYLLPSHRIVDIDKYVASDIEKDMASHNIIHVPSRNILPSDIIHRAIIPWIARRWDDTSHGRRMHFLVSYTDGGESL